MIGSLRGEILERDLDGSVMIEVGGVGYVVHVSQRALAELEPASPAFLYIHHHIREADQQLFGFQTRDERTTFQTLIGTHGVGPALGMAIIATHPPVALVDIVAARLTSPAEEVLVVFVGSTGSGKSTLLNALFGESITEAGVKRPTTLAPLVVTHPSRASQHRIAAIGGAEEARAVTRDVALTRHLTFVDSPDPDSVTPGHASMARALANVADLIVPVTTPSRYADAIPWDLFARRWRVGIPSLPVMNRIRADRDGRMQVGHLVARAAMAGLPLETEEVLRIPERPGVGILAEDIAELVDVLIEVGSEDRNQTVGQARRGAAVDGLGAARRFVDDVEELEAGLRRTKRMTEAAWQAVSRSPTVRAYMERVQRGEA
nr:ATP-binding cassette domain-containing protein [Ilumatobacter sp.]